MVSVVFSFSTEDKIQYFKVKPIRRRLRNTNAQYITNENIIKLCDLGINFTDEIISEIEFNRGFVNYITLT